MFTVRQATRVSFILVLLITEDASKPRLAATGVRVGVDWQAGTMDALVAITGVADLLVTQCSCPARVAGAGEATMPCWVAVTLDADASLAGLAAWFYPLAQPLSGGALCHLRAWSPWLQPSTEVLELPIDVQITEAAMKAGAIAST